MVFGKRKGQNLIIQLFQLNFDDVVFDCIVMIFLQTDPYTSYQNLLRLNVIFIVRKIGQLLFKGGGRGGSGCHPPAPSLCLILGPRW